MWGCAPAVSRGCERPCTAESQVRSVCTAWCLVAVRGRSAVVGAVVHARRQHQHHDADGSAAGELLGVAHQHDVTHLRGVCDGERQHVQQAQHEPRGEWLCVWVQCALLIVSMRHDAAADRVSRCDGAVTCQRVCVCVWMGCVRVCGCVVVVLCMASRSRWTSLWRRLHRRPRPPASRRRCRPLDPSRRQCR